LLYWARIEAVMHTAVLSTRRRGTVRRNQDHRRGQLVLELEPQDRPVPVERSPKELVEALADLLLAAVGIDGTTSTSKEGIDEQQNHG
jgi:hypothetical protein